ncbi:hypothetical protein ACO0KZ_04140 [Undibacterium sp. Di24W]
MATIGLVLAGENLENSDTELCVQRPRWIENHSQGEVQTLGWDYSIEDEMNIFFAAEDKEHGLQKICGALASELVLENDLSSATIAWRGTDSWASITLYPPEIVGRIVEDITA